MQLPEPVQRRRRGAVSAAMAAALLVVAAAEVSRGEEASPPRTPSAADTARAHLERAEQFRSDAVDMYRCENPLAVDGFYAAAREAWDAVWSCPGSPELVAAAGEEYAKCLEGLLASARRHGRLDGCRGLVVGSKWDPLRVPLVMQGHTISSREVIDILPVPPPGDKRISRCHVRGGFGLPVVIRTVDEPPDEEQEETSLIDLDARAAQAALDHDFLPPRQSLASTAVLRFAMPEEPGGLQKLIGPVHGDPPAAVLDLVNPVEVARVRIGPLRPQLAGDLTSPLLDMLEGMPQRSNVEGFLQPFGRNDTLPRLEMLEPYVPGRIPVVFIHGLASDEGTWFDLLNELRVWPAFHRRFTPWVFHYPTGAPFVQTSAQLRQQLRRLVARLDPAGTDPALQQLVLVGHSMGGLHAKMMAVASGNQLWDAICYVPFDQVRLPERLRQPLRDSFFFEPLPFVRRVVYIATPHGGSSWATRTIGRVASAAVRQPRQLQAVHRAMIESNPPGTFHEGFEQRVPTTIDTLEPTSPVLSALRNIPLAPPVASHTIVGMGCLTEGVTDGDGVVSVQHGRIAGVYSERFVQATHTKVHHQPDTVEELIAILTAHAEEAGLATIPATASLPQPLGEAAADAEANWRPKRR